MTLHRTVEKKLAKRKDKVTNRIEQYVKSPEDRDAVHEVRISLRRLEATFSLLPKKTRRANSEYLKTCRMFFRANSKIRDCDVIKQRIGTHAPAVLVHELETSRKSELGRAKKLAALLVNPPLIRQLNLQKSKVEDRADKVAGKLVKRIEKLVPLVLEDEHKVDDLHLLRKKCKMLRYVLDTVRPAYTKRHESDFAKIMSLYGKKMAEKDVNVSLRELQDILGAIHDNDITIEFIEAHDAKQLMSIERQKRKQAYQKFVSYMSQHGHAAAAVAKT